MAFSIVRGLCQPRPKVHAKRGESGDSGLGVKKRTTTQTPGFVFVARDGTEWPAGTGIDSLESLTLSPGR